MNNTVEKYTASYYIFRALLYPIALTFNPKFYGKENIPQSGPVIIAANHRHAADPGFSCMSTKRPVHFLAKKELHDGPFSLFFKFAGTIPVDRSRHNNGAMEAAEEVLNNGGLIGIFPEGTRNRTDEPIQPLKYGAVRLAQKTGAKIVPLAVANLDKPFTSHTRICIGEPYNIEKDADLEAENKKLRQKMTELYLRARDMK